MSSLWTPGGERPIRRPEPEQSSTSGESQAASARAAAGRQQQELSPEEQAAQLQQLQEQLARTPVDLVIANHAFGLFELAALHLGLQPPQLDQARLAIDALAALVEGLAGRLGDRPAIQPAEAPPVSGRPPRRCAGCSTPPIGPGGLRRFRTRRSHPRRSNGSRRRSGCSETGSERHFLLAPRRGRPPRRNSQSSRAAPPRSGRSVSARSLRSAVR